MNHHIKVIDGKGSRGRILAAVIFVCVLLFCWFAVRWQIGHMLVELTPVNDPAAGRIAEASASLAPSDPMPFWLAGSKMREEFSADAITAAVELMEKAVRNAPMDYRWWIELGRALEQADQSQRADTAFQKAIELAPEYAFPRWQFGNFLIRQDRVDEAFAQLKRSAEKNSVYREQVFSLAWDYFDKDPRRVEEFASDSPDVRANLALFYAVRSASEDSLRMWNLLPDDKKAEHQMTAKIIAQGLYHKGLYRQSLEFARQTGIDPEAAFEAITNGGFEGPLGNPDDTLFGWKVVRTEGRVDVQSDTSIIKEGKRSLRINFRSYDKPEYYNLTQTIAIEPGARYRLTFHVRTENLASAGPPLVQVWNIAANALIAQSDPFTGGTSDWRLVTIDFTAPNDVQGIALRTARAYCGEGCPLIGIIWYDDFRLERL